MSRTGRWPRVCQQGVPGSRMRLVKENLSIVDDYLAKEVKVKGLMEAQTVGHIEVNRFGIIPKNHQVGKWRLIVDLYYPKGYSVNDGIEPVLCSLNYTSVDI